MSDSNRNTGYSFDLTMMVGAAFTVVALCVFLFFLGFKYGADNERPKQQAASSASKANEDAKLACFNSVATFDKIDCLEKQIKAEHESHRAEYDLAAQQQMADWALFIVIISGVQAILSLGGVYLLVRNLSLAREATNAAVDANKVAREIGEAQVRAYLIAETCSFDFTKTDAGAIGVIYFGLSNTGQSPAFDLRIDLGLTMISKGNPNIPAAGNPEQHHCQIPTRVVPTVSPKFEGSFPLAIPRSSFPGEWRERISSGRVMILLNGTIRWTDVFKKTHRVTILGTESAERSYYFVDPPVGVFSISNIRQE